MLTAVEEEDLINSLPISKQCTAEEAALLLMVYRSKLKKYHIPHSTASTQENKSTIQSILGIIPLAQTPLNKLASLSFLGTPSTNQNEKGNSSSQDLKPDKATPMCDAMVVEENSTFPKLQQSLDFLVTQAEQLYYNCDYQKCGSLTETVLKQDPYHTTCLPIHISCQVELKQSNKLFTLAHKLVDLYPNLAISWFAVGCYYYIIGKSDSARRYLAKATSLDRLFGPAWLAYGHSFAIENEHDQAMAAYFKASQLMKGCHLPLLYIGLECGLTNNVVLATKFFQQVIKIAPQDPFVLHEMGVIAFQSANYVIAEKHFREAIKIVKSNNYHTLLPERWAPLLNNLGHALRKQRKHQEALEYHEEALALCPQIAATYSAIAYIHSLTGNISEAVNWFHKALGLRRDDTFSTTMLDYLLEYLADEETPYTGAPSYIPDFNPEAKSEESTAQEISDM
ncbi:Tetratricopeptide repeat-containing protein, partial [Oryctes borbonicus]